MKKSILPLFIFLIINCVFAQQPHYDVTAGNGNGVRLWNNDAYKIHMGNSSEYLYGTVTDYSVKMNMSNNPGRGWTWGIAGATPIASLNTLGNMQISGSFQGKTLLLTDPNATDDWNTLWQSGFYQSYNATNAPESDQWFWGINMNHSSNNSSYKYNGQIAIKNSSTIPTLYFRSTNKDGIGTWAKVLNNKGTQSIDGSLGIGVTNPAAKLHVAEGVQLRKTTIGLTAASAENGWIRDEWLTGAYGPAKWDQTKTKWVRPAGNYNDIGGIVYQDEGTYFLREKAGTQLEYTNDEFLNTSFMFAHIATGNVGIGTTDPKGYKLAVAGTIISEEIVVELEANWPDYVFKENYNLPTLQQVENHIAQKGHLINIPSAAEVAENGIQLGEMNAKLLEKIEELTLYTIAQEKKLEKMDALETKNLELEARLAKIETILNK